jgi:putative ABC transport system permease protein
VAHRDWRFRWILRLLPPSFREEYEREILSVWQEEARQRGGHGTHHVWVQAMTDTLRVAPKEHVLATMRNLAVGARRLRKSPAFAITAILTLACGTGAAAAVFALVNAVLLRPMPWNKPEQVGLVWAIQPSGARTWLSFPELERLQRETAGLTGASGITDLRPHYEHDGVGEELQALAVSHGFFAMLGVPPALGRDFTSDDDRDGARLVVILSHAFWQMRFGGDPGVLSRTLKLNQQDYSIVGVMPARFELLAASTVLPDSVDVWLPLEPHLPSRDRSVRFLHVLARLRPGVTLSDADTELRSYGARVSHEFPAAYPGGPWALSIVSFTDDVLKNAKPILYLLLGLVLLVVIIACSNVANLLLARGEARRTELAIRTALGAGPARLAGELLAESFLLALCGSVAGLVVATLLPRVLRAVDPGALPRLGDAGLDLRVLAFVLGLMVLTLLIFAALPLVERLRLRNVSSLLGGKSGGRTKRTATIAKTLVIAQTAFATAILVAALVLTDMFITLRRVDLGFSPEHVLSGRISLSPKYPAGPPSARFFDAATAAIQSVPGVIGAAAITQLPLSGAMLGSSFLLSPEPEARRIDADLRGITPDYFKVLGTSLISGRFFSDLDSADSPRVVIVDQAFANRISSDGRVIGRRLRWFRQPDVELEIIGVVSSVRHRGPEHPARETVYRPQSQYPRSSMFLAIRTAREDGATLDAVRRALASVDPTQPFADISTMDQRLGRTMARARTSLMLATTLAILAMGLGGVGLYGVLSVGVAQRKREFGVRMTLGATQQSLRALVLKEGLILGSAGAVLGVTATLAFVTVVRSVLSQTHIVRPSLYVGGVLLVLLFSAIAVWIPAHRASATDPIASLKAD